MLPAGHKSAEPVKAGRPGTSDPDYGPASVSVMERETEPMADVPLRGTSPMRKWARRSQDLWSAGSHSRGGNRGCSTSISPRRGELHRAHRRRPGGALAARRGAAHASHRPALGGLPQPVQPRGRGGALCRVLSPLRHGTGPQQRRRQPREWCGRSFARPSEDRFDEALELRGARDFPDLAAYQAFLQEFI